MLEDGAAPVWVAGVDAVQDGELLERDRAHRLELAPPDGSLGGLRVAEHEGALDRHEESVVRVQEGGEVAEDALQAREGRRQAGRVEVHLQVDRQLLGKSAGEQGIEQCDCIGRSLSQTPKHDVLTGSTGQFGRAKIEVLVEKRLPSG